MHCFKIMCIGINTGIISVIIQTGSWYSLNQSIYKKGSCLMNVPNSLMSSWYFLLLPNLTVQWQNQTLLLQLYYFFF